MWNDLTLSQKASIIGLAVKNNIKSLKDIQDLYDSSLHKYEDGGDKRYQNMIYNPMKEGIYAYEKNDMGELMYPSFKEWANGNNYNDAAPDWMFKEGYDGPRTFGTIYENFSKLAQDYNTERRMNYRREHPDRFWNTYHDAALRETQDGSVSDVLGGALSGINTIAGAVMQAPVELAKSYTLPGYIPYVGSNNPYIQQSAEGVDKGINYALAPFMLSNWVDWGSAGKEGSHVKLPWQQNSDGVQTPAFAQTLDLIGMPYTMKLAGTSANAIKNQTKGNTPVTLMSYDTTSGVTLPRKVGRKGGAGRINAEIDAAEREGAKMVNGEGVIPYGPFYDLIVDPKTGKVKRIKGRNGTTAASQLDKIGNEFGEGVTEATDWFEGDKYAKISEDLAKEAADMGPDYDYVPYRQRKFYTEGDVSTEIMDFNEGFRNQSTQGSTSIASPLSSILRVNPFRRSHAEHTGRHEGTHGVRIGMPDMNGESNPANVLNYAQQENFLLHKNQQVYNKGILEYPYGDKMKDIVDIPAEGIALAGDVGYDLGLTYGQEYPGYEVASKMLKDYIDGGGYKADVAKAFKTDEASMPFVWKALTGAQMGVAPFLMGLFGDNEKAYGGKLSSSHKYALGSNIINTPVLDDDKTKKATDSGSAVIIRDDTAPLMNNVQEYSGNPESLIDQNYIQDRAQGAMGYSIEFPDDFAILGKAHKTKKPKSKKQREELFLPPGSTTVPKSTKVKRTPLIPEANPVQFNFTPFQEYEPFVFDTPYTDMLMKRKPTLY